MKKRYLISYKIYPLQGFDDTGFEMTILTVYLWGLFRSISKEPFFIPNHHRMKGYTDKWDRLIESKSLLQ